MPFLPAMLIVILLLFCCSTLSIGQLFGLANNGGTSKLFGSSFSIQAEKYGVNMAPWGPDAGDEKVMAEINDYGNILDLHMNFPFYGGSYNQTKISINGYVSFAPILDQGPTIHVGVEHTDWPRVVDPAMIAPYLCKQQVAQGPLGVGSGVYYRMVMRQTLFGRAGNVQSGPNSFFSQTAEKACAGTNSYVLCDPNSDLFLDEMMRWLQDGVAGASVFKADAALIVTWYHTASAIVGRSDMGPDSLATYQMIWMTNREGSLSYAILNYDKLGFEAADFGSNAKSGRCQALFNGGNHTGTVMVDITDQYKMSPKILARRSSVPHVVRGRYMFRVDDVVRPAGCSNKTGGTYPLLIYPDIVNMLGEMTVDVNGLCMDPLQTYVLMIEQRPSAACQMINTAIARCYLPKVYDWGTKTVFFQPQSSGVNEEKAYVGFIYFVPPTLDPMRLDIGNLHNWFKNPIPSPWMPIAWFPRNFTDPEFDYRNGRIGDDAMYNVKLGLFVIGYKESQDITIKKFRPVHRTLARLATFTNKNSIEFRWKAQEERITLSQVEYWYLTADERRTDLFTYRMGYLKLAPIRQNLAQAETLLSGLVSSPVSLHWLWTTDQPNFPAGTSGFAQDDKKRVEFVEDKAIDMCHDWYDEDGAQWNFIRETEMNASCPCVEDQAKLDIGRFMPHPRCSQLFRDVTCTSTLGAQNCYMSAQNIYGTPLGNGVNNADSKTSRFATHYGQVCCYDSQGKLMQTSYQPVVNSPFGELYSPGFPMRAYEFGTSPFQGQYEVPGLSGFYHDLMPYFFCCKYAKYRCQLFYWRRPSSGCQEYQPSAIGKSMGAGSFHTIDNEKFIFNEPGVFTLLYIPQTVHSPEVNIQIRLERYPNRKVDFSLLGGDMDQDELVQLTNATVITGISLESSDSERVHVVARKDTRRFRYRTSIIVGNILRYFDTMTLQRYKGVLIYVNNVQRGQAEVYVVLEKSQIGIRIRESYALDIDRVADYHESMGLLDIAISVPPHFGVRPDGDKTREQETRQRYGLPKVQGLMRPFPDMNTVTSNFNRLSMNDINSDAIRKQIISNYLIPGTGINTDIGGATNREIPSVNLFTSSRDQDKKFEGFPDAALKNLPIYKSAPRFDTGDFSFVAQTGEAVNQLLRRCRSSQQRNNVNAHLIPTNLLEDSAENCPDDPGNILSECGESVSCIYDYTMLQLKVLGHEAKDSWNSFLQDRMEATRHYNSCGAINLEYPEYLHKTPTLASGYLEGDVARFECFQSHWVKGDNEYSCTKVVDPRDPNKFSFEWNKGWQPWCRSRERDNIFKWMTAVISCLAFLSVFALIFLCCWCSKRRYVEKNRSVRGQLNGFGKPRRKLPKLFPDTNPYQRNNLLTTGVKNVPTLTNLGTQNPAFQPTSPLRSLDETIVSPSPFNHDYRSYSHLPDRPEIPHDLRDSRSTVNSSTPPRREPQPFLGLNTSV